MTADVIFLQEMDVGVSRSGHIDAARELAKALGMNYAFGAQTLEVDPVMLDRDNEFDTKNLKFSAMRGFGVGGVDYNGYYGSPGA